MNNGKEQSKMRSTKTNPSINYSLKLRTKEESWFDENSEAEIVVVPAGKEIEERYRKLLKMAEASQT